MNILNAFKNKIMRNNKKSNDGNANLNNCKEITSIDKDNIIAEAINSDVNSPYFYNIKSSGKHSEVNYCLKDIYTSIKICSLETKRLLEEKGFENSFNKNSIYVKNIMLSTEVSELVDAVKKKKGNNEEGMELADIIIRACNFICPIEFNQFSYVMLDVLRDKSENINITVMDFDTDIVRDKYKIASNLNLCCSKLVSLTNILLVLLRKANKTTAALNVAQDQCYFEEIPYLNDNITETARLIHANYKNLLEVIAVLYANCKLYAEKYLDKTVDEYIEEKMNFNYSRPYKYNNNF